MIEDGCWVRTYLNLGRQQLKPKQRKRKTQTHTSQGQSGLEMAFFMRQTWWPRACSSSCSFLRPQCQLDGWTQSDVCHTKFFFFFSLLDPWLFLHLLSTSSSSFLCCSERDLNSPTDKIRIFPRAMSLYTVYAVHVCLGRFKVSLLALDGSWYT